MKRASITVFPHFRKPAAHLAKMTFRRHSVTCVAHFGQKYSPQPNFGTFFLMGSPNTHKSSSVHACPCEGLPRANSIPRQNALVPTRHALRSASLRFRGTLGRCLLCCSLLFGFQPRLQAVCCGLRASGWVANPSTCPCICM